MAPKSKFLVTALTISLAAAFGLVGDASAAKQKKLTFEQAWASCKAELDKEKISGTLTSTQERYARGGACMKRHGYNL